MTSLGEAGAGDPGPSFDQHSIEVAALAASCAAMVEDDTRWANGVAMAVGWFLGANDAKVEMWESATGGCYHDLQPDDANRNQSTESTLALLSTLQHARHLVPAN